MIRRVSPPTSAHTYPTWHVRLQAGSVVEIGRETYQGFVLYRSLTLADDAAARAVYDALADMADRIETLADAIRHGDDMARAVALRSVTG